MYSVYFCKAVQTSETGARIQEGGFGSRPGEMRYLQCNFWGDPHFTKTWRNPVAFDYQRGGVNQVAKTNDHCNPFEMQVGHAILCV